MADRTVRVILSANIQQYRAAMQQAAHSTAEFGRELTTNSKRSNELLHDMGRGAMVAGAGLVAGFAIAGRAAMNFDQQMSAVAAATMASRSEIDALRQAALDAGQATAFSATESAAAIENLAKAGISTADILGGALTGSLNLAAAGGLEVADAAEIAATALTQFDLSGSQMGHVADLLAAGAGKAQGDVSDLGMALRQSGLVAAQTGLTIEETTAALASFASAGLLGSDAGTSLKSMLQRLTPTSAESAEEMDRLGFSAFDAQGNFVGLTALAGEMQSSFGNLTVEQRNLAMATIFGSDAVRAAGVLFNEGADGIANWQTEVNDAGFAAEQAQIRMDNLAGDLEQLGGALETALIEGGSKATGALRFFTQSATSAVNSFAELPSVVQTGVVAFAGLGGAVLTAGGAVAWALPKWYKLTDSLFELGPAGQKAASGLNKLASAGIVAGGVIALAGAVNMVQDALSRPNQRSAAQLADDLLKFASTGDVAGEAAVAFGDDLSGLAADVRAAAMDLDNINQGTMPESWRQGREDVQALDEALANLVTSGGARQARDILDELGGALEGTGVSAEDLMQLLPGYADALASVSTQSELAAGSQEALSDAINPVTADVEAATQAIKDYADAQAAAIDPLFGMLDAVRGNRDAQLDYEDALRDVGDKQQAVTDAIREHGAMSEEAGAAQRDYEDAIRAVDAAYGDVASSALDVHQAAITLAAGIQSGSVSLDEATSMLQAWVGQGLLTAEQAAVLADQFGAVADQADDLEGRNVSIVLHAATEDATASINQLDHRLQQLARGVTVPVWMVQHGSINQIEHTSATGGFVPDFGRGPGDNVHALLESGEFVINKASAQRIGAQNLHRLNKMASGGVVGAGHSFATWNRNMIGNLSGTPVGRNVVRAAGPDGDPAGDLQRLLDLYTELSDKLGQAAADQILWSTQTQEGFELVAHGALAAQEAIDEAAQAAAELAVEHEHMHDVMFAVGDMKPEEYLEILRQRLAATETYSDEWYGIWQDINRITEDAVQEEQATLEAAQRELDQTLSDLSQMYVRATTELERQQEAYATAVSERARRLAAAVAEFRGGIVDTFRSIANPIDIFGSMEDVTAGGVEAALRHRVEATRRFAETYTQLAARGVRQDVLTQLAQRGPEGLSLAEALLKVDPALVNEAMSQTEQLGAGVADIALQWEQARIQADVYAEVALPMVQDLNELLAEEQAAFERTGLLQAEAEAWARRMAEEVYPALAASAKDAADASERLADATAGGASKGGVVVVGAGIGPIDAKSLDEGGWLDPGWNLAWNGLGHPEPVGAAAGMVINNQVVIHAAPGTDVAAVRRAADEGSKSGVLRAANRVETGARR